MSDIIIIEDRTISGVGLIRVPENRLNYRQYFLFAQVIRKPTNEYLSFEHSPPQGFYARMSFLKNGYVVATDQIRYSKEKRTYNPEITGQNLIAIQCAYKGILQSFVNLGDALSLAVTEVTDAIADIKTQPLTWDEIQVACFADTAIAFSLKAIEYNICTEEYPTPLEEPDPPEEEPPVPPGTPIEISPPYDDDDITNKAPIDEEFVDPEDLPTGVACNRYQIDFTWTNSSTGLTNSRTWYVRGQYIPGSLGITNNSISSVTFVIQAQASSQNIPGINAQVCGALREVSLGSATPGNPTDITLVAVTPLDGM